MKARPAVLALAGAAALASLASVIGIVAWPEMTASAYFLKHGWRLYDQVIEMYTPLLVGLVAGAGALAGFDTPAFRSVVGAGLFVQGLLLGWGILRGRPTPWRAAAFGAGLAAIAAWTAYFDGYALYPDPFLAPFALGAVLLLERFDRTGRLRWLAWGGLVLGAGILVKQTFAWAAVGAALWLVLSARSRRWPAVLTLAGTVAAPFLAFAAGWGAAFGTSAHLRWTFLIPFTHHAPDMGTLPDHADLLESVAPFLVLATLALLSPRRRPGSPSSPLVWIAIATAGMAWPRWGLLHLSATTGVLGLALARSLRAGFLQARRGERSDRGWRRAAALGTAGGLLATHVAVGAAGGGIELLHQARSGVRYWDEPELRACAAEAERRVGPTREFLSYYATLDNVYVLARGFPPGALYVNSGPVFFLEADGLEDRLVAALAARPGLPVLYREPSGAELEWTARTGKLREFLAVRTRRTGPSVGGGEWRVVTLAAESAAESRPPGAERR
ncbi:MAG: glycosyltransferase family 39 protein [Thermoanaerobaculia bacterium]